MKITTQIIKKLKPCKHRLDNFLEYYSDFNGDHEEFLSMDKINHIDKLWVLLRIMKRVDVEVFAIDCAVSAYGSYAYDATSACAASVSDAPAYAIYAIYAPIATSAYASAAAAATYAIYASTTAAAASYAANEEERQVEALIYLINKGEK